MNSRRNSTKLMRITGVILITGLLLSALPILSVSAAPDLYVATTGTDSGTCPSSSPCLTVGYAVTQAVSGDTIHIAAGTYNNVNLYVDKSLTFIGAGMTQTILDGGGSDGIMVVYSSRTVSVTDLTIQNGKRAGGDGGGIGSFGTLNLTRVKVTGNSALSGGGISSNGPLTMVDCEVTSNNANSGSATGYGGGLILYSGTSSISKTTISGNTATGYSGGIHVQGTTTVDITNVTISGNTGMSGGGMITSGTGTANLLNSTIADNHFLSGGSVGGILNYGIINFKNTIVSNNDAQNCTDGSSFWTSLGNNLDSGTSCGFTQTGDLQSTDPQIGALGNNGGLTQTHALPVGSPAIDAGTNTGCPATDQRGVSRPRDGDTNGTATCDMGAYEYRTNLSYKYSSAGAYDGWILESTENSTAGGTLDKTATTFRLGDDAGDKQYRAILSFNTANLPDNAIIKKVTLQIKKQGLTGLNPFTGFGGLKVDIRKPFFGTGIGLLINDFQAAASRSAVGTFNGTPISNWYSANIGSAGYPDINTTGTTQFRLRFYLGDNDNASADYMKFFSGNYTTVASRPTLIIEYDTP